VEACAVAAWEAVGRAPADRASFEVFQTLHLAVASQLLPQILRGGEALVARASPKETRAAKVARLRD
jgi:hypothetical protein